VVSVIYDIRVSSFESESASTTGMMLISTNRLEVSELATFEVYTAFDDFPLFFKTGL